MSELATTYLGLQLRSPIVASAGPHTGDPLTVERLEAGGAGGAVLPSLFEEEILHEEMELNRALEVSRPTLNARLPRSRTATWRSSRRSGLR